MAGDSGAGQALVPPILLRVMAARAMRRRDWSAGMVLYKRAVKRSPRRDDIWVQYGHALKESGDHSGAERAYREALKLKPNVADTHLQIGHLLKLMERYEEAASAYLVSAELDPERPDARIELGNLRASGRLGSTSVPHLPTDQSVTDHYSSEELIRLRQRVQHLESAKGMLEDELAQSRAAGSTRLGPAGKQFTASRGQEGVIPSTDAWITEMTSNQISMCTLTAQIRSTTRIQVAFDNRFEAEIPMESIVTRTGMTTDIVPFSVHRPTRETDNELSKLEILADGRTLLSNIYVDAQAAIRLDTSLETFGAAHYGLFSDAAFR